MRISVISFGFKFGIPRELDLLVDVRFIPNPYCVPDLRDLDGTDQRVQDYIKRWPETVEFMDRFLSFLEFLLPLYKKQGKADLTVGIGCTGGHHRSVAVAEEIFRRLKRSNSDITLDHRDVNLSAP